MANINSNTDNITDNFDSLDNNMSTAEAICEAVAAAIEGNAICADGARASRLSDGSITTLLLHAATLLNVANAEAYSLRLHALENKSA